MNGEPGTELTDFSRLNVFRKTCNPGQGDQFECIRGESSMNRHLFMEVIINPNGIKYYAFNWPSPVNRTKVVKIVTDLGLMFGAEEYQCNNGSPKHISYCGTLTPEEEIAKEEFFGRSPDLAKVYVDDFVNLGVTCEDVRLIWSSKESLLKRDNFGLIADGATPLSSSWLQNLLAETLSEDLRGGIDTFTASFDRLFQEAS